MELHDVPGDGNVHVDVHGDGEPPQEQENGSLPDGLDWQELRKEFGNLFQFKENRSWWMIVRTSLIIFATSVGPSLFDMGSDGLSMYHFINGTTYTKYVPDLNHSSQCTHVGTHLRNNGNRSEVVYLEVECFEQDPIWGYMSLFFMFLPGLGGFAIWNGLKPCLLCSWIGWLTLPLFPFVLLTVKTIGVFNPGENWKILARRCSFVEGSWESRFQLLLQLFIVFTRADRAPSSVQLATMTSSVVMLSLSSLNNIRRQQKTVELGDEVRRALYLLPGILAASVSSTLLLALLATLLRYWVLLPLVLVVLALIVIHISRQRQLRSLGTMADKTFERVPVGLIEMSEFELARKLSEKMLSLCLILLMTILTITVNVHPSLKLPGLALWKVIRNYLFLK